MNIETIDVSRIDPAPYNPRKDLRPGDPDYERLARSIDEFGFVEPLVWNTRTGTLVAGQQRLKVLLARGDKQVECSVVDLPLERDKALNSRADRPGAAQPTTPAPASRLSTSRSTTSPRARSTEPGFRDRRQARTE